MLRRRRKEAAPAFDPASVGPRWRPAAHAALDARAQMASLLGRLGAGPMRDRLTAMAADLERQVTACLEVVSRADHLERVVADLRPAQVVEEHKAAQRELLAAEDAGPVPERLAETAAVLRERHASVQRLLNALESTDEQLRLVEARLQHVVAGAAEVALRSPGDRAAFDRLDGDLAGVTDELTALRQGLEAVG